ncbi:MAG TPA: hypothetical protein VK672_08015 [Solirubrobacteraceae bacterium]|jgi:hypothetical protein|nr:hypothetical protein [Solirubrobacteraceae bacterium]
MTTLLLERSPTLDEGFEQEARRRLGGAPLSGTAGAHGRLTLDDLITGVWEGLAVRGTVNCPVCASAMVLRLPSHGDDAPMGTCLDCGSRLS